VRSRSSVWGGVSFLAVAHAARLEEVETAWSGADEGTVPPAETVTGTAIGESVMSA
jgi:hypothetical protein